MNRNEPNLVNAIHNNIALIADAVAEIRDIAGNLRSVGIDLPAQQLAAAIEGLEASAKHISDMHMDELNGSIRHSEEFMGGMLKLVLDGRIGTAAETEGQS